MTNVMMGNEYEPDSGCTHASSTATTICSVMELRYQNAANELKAFSGMRTHAPTNSRQST